MVHGVPIYTYSRGGTVHNTKVNRKNGPASRKITKRYRKRNAGAKRIENNIDNEEGTESHTKCRTNYQYSVRNYSVSMSQPNAVV